ncbi:MAG: tRNA (adenosine(37)-N6)-threonylcarbamoyltransferase complex ATPase subunit type 1 TsaE [Proteobacteria bacterium]|nr:tRNA (adenosine(37)-N6)-threonylcarbamoyltransferase complex ATPase subunit type 1 TsaE [Pseudomonadota bacterium]HQR03158.1 tRNA (adenosine(37)-N6)-threonylcarbamoyltransferase complex ATPase subunit type 1 TsaE [Rhodocyclaceae bacterium]
MHADDDKSFVVDLPDEAATLALGARLGSVLGPGAVLYLEGDLGVGKTTLVRGILRSLGYAGRVKSPTYTLVEPHVVSGLYLYHFDFYRFNQPEEYLDAGLDEYFSDGNVCLVEWPDKAAPYLPPADMRICLEPAGSGRHAHLRAGSAKGRQWLTCVAGLTNLASPDETSSVLPPPA